MSELDLDAIREELTEALYANAELEKQNGALVGRIQELEEGRCIDRNILEGLRVKAEAERDRLLRRSGLGLPRTERSNHRPVGVSLMTSWIKWKQYAEERLLAGAEHPASRAGIFPDDEVAKGYLSALELIGEIEDLLRPDDVTSWTDRVDEIRIAVRKFRAEATE